MTIVWACPDCGAPHGRHGKGECRHGRRDIHHCEGLVCDCAHNVSADHGESHEDPCHNATCDHCGWVGMVPPLPYDPAKLKGWAKKAHEAGWKPPKGWTP